MALYADKPLIDAFVQENPQNFAKDRLAIVSNWKNYIQGDFHIERFLKRYAVLIKDDNVYGVLGLYQGFEEFLYLGFNFISLFFQSAHTFIVILTRNQTHFQRGFILFLKIFKSLELS